MKYVHAAVLLLSFFATSSHAGKFCNAPASPKNENSRFLPENELSVKDFCATAAKKFNERQQWLKDSLRFGSDGDCDDIPQCIKNLSKAYASAQDSIEDLVSFVFELSTKTYSLPSSDERSSSTKQLNAIINNAIEMNKKGYISFYTARYSNGSLTSDLAHALHCQHKGCVAHDEQALFVRDPSKTDSHESISAYINSLTNNEPANFADNAIGDWKMLGISSNIFVDGGSKKKDEYTWDYYQHQDDGSPVNTQRDSGTFSDVKTTLSSFNCVVSDENIDILLASAGEYFKPLRPKSYMLYQISIREDKINDVALLTMDWGRQFSPLYDYFDGSLNTLDFLTMLRRGKYSFWDKKFFEWSGKNESMYMSSLNSLQARVFVKQSIFANPEFVKVKRYRNDENTDDKKSAEPYLKKLEEWVKNYCPRS